MLLEDGSLQLEPHLQQCKTSAGFAGRRVEGMAAWSWWVLQSTARSPGWVGGGSVLLRGGGGPKLCSLLAVLLAVTAVPAGST